MQVLRVVFTVLNDNRIKINVFMIVSLVRSKSSGVIVFIKVFSIHYTSSCYFFCSLFFLVDNGTGDSYRFFLGAPDTHI